MAGWEPQPIIMTGFFQLWNWSWTGSRGKGGCGGLLMWWKIGLGIGIGIGSGSGDRDVLLVFWARLEGGIERLKWEV